MVEERFHPTWPLPLRCRLAHCWRDRDSQPDPRHYVRRRPAYYAFEQCERCGARQVRCAYLDGQHAPCDRSWVRYEDPPRVPTTDRPRSAVPPKPLAASMAVTVRR